VHVGRDAPLTLTELITEISRMFEVSLNEICSPCQRRAPARARAAVAHLAVERLGLPGKAVAAVLRVSPSAVSHALHRGRAVVEEERLQITSNQTEPDGEWS
jgi:hypothetical protein